MKKNVKAIWGVACYPLMYIAVQGLISVICSFVTGIVVGVQNAGEIASMTQEQITEMVLANYNVQIPLLLTAVIVFAVMLLLLDREWKRESFWRAGNLNVPFILICLVSGIGLNLFTIGAINLTRLTDLFPEYEQLMGNLVGNSFVLEIICLGVFIPFIEEVIFRGVVFSRLKKITKLPVALVVQAFLFALIHFNILQSSYAFILGIVLGLACLWLDSVWAVAAMHIAYNLTSLIISYSMGETELSVAALAVMTVAGIAAGAACLYAFAKRAGRAKADL